MKRALFASIALAFGANAMAQPGTCADPLPITSNSVVSGDLCTASNTLPVYGGVPSPQREIIYSFVANGADATLELTHTGAPFGGTMFVMPSPCSLSTDPISLGDFGTPMPVGPGQGINDGETYYIIVTADPGGDPDACGPFQVTVNGTLPVELESFTVE